MPVKERVGNGAGTDEATNLPQDKPCVSIGIGELEHLFGHEPGKQISKECSSQGSSVY